MYHKLIKLTNGENILAVTDDNCDTFKDKEFIHVLDPLLLATLTIPRGGMVIESYVLQPWLRVAKEDLIKIPVSSIVLVADLEDNTIQQYNSYVKNMNSSTSDNDVLNFEDEEEGDESLEQILQAVLGGESEEEDDGQPRTTRSGKTIH